MIILQAPILLNVCCTLSHRLGTQTCIVQTNKELATNLTQQELSWQQRLTAFLHMYTIQTAKIAGQVSVLTQSGCVSINVVA